MPPPSRAAAVTRTITLPGVERTRLARWEKVRWPNVIFDPDDFFFSSSSSSSVFSAWTKRGQIPFLRAAMRRQSSARNAVKNVA